MVERFSRIRTLGEKNVGSLTFTRGQKNLTPRFSPSWIHADKILS